MKIAIFTPIHTNSAIGHVSALVRSALQVAGHDVALVTTELHAPGAGEANLALVDATSWRDDSAVRQIVAEADLVLHQVGDHYPFHAGTVHWLPRVGGCIALHDFFLGDLFLSWLERNLIEGAGILQEWYGLELEEYLHLARSGNFAKNTWPQYSLVEWLCQYADGVIVHSDFALESVRKATNAPIVLAALPYELRRGETGTLATRKASSDDGKLRVLTFGRINPNKLSDMVIAAIASSKELRNGIEYRVVGSITVDDRRYLEELAGDLGVALTVTGEVSTSVLVDELETCDLIICARNPTLESASASAIEGMLSGSPIAVLDSGFYHALPDDCVLKIPATNVQLGLRGLLREVMGGRHDLAAIAQRAKLYAEKTFRADSYASELVQLGRESARRRPLRELDRAFSDLSRRRAVGLGDVHHTYEKDSQIFRL